MEWGARAVRGEPVITDSLLIRADSLLMTARGQAAGTRYNLEWVRPHTVFTYPEMGESWWIARPVTRIAVGACPACMCAGSDCRLRSRSTRCWTRTLRRTGPERERPWHRRRNGRCARIWASPWDTLPSGPAATGYCSPPAGHGPHAGLLLDAAQGAPGRWDTGRVARRTPGNSPAKYALTQAGTLIAFGRIETKTMRR